MTLLGSLREVRVRDAWNHEAHTFTPWLAENLNLLADTLGITLELENSEVAVGGFAADILARNPLDDSLVLIENQLESTNHGHLGQILTYLAGLQVQTIVWIAVQFREEHLSAIRWLNEHTVNPFAFFAVKVKVVQINDSPLAPVFEVVERPNQWDRYLQEVAKPEPSASTQRKLAFWTHFVERFPDEEAYGKPTGANNRWHKFPNYQLVISIYAARDCVGTFIRGMHGANATDVAAILAPQQSRLRELTGSSKWNEETGHYFHQSFPGDFTRPESCNAMCDWLHGTVARYERALHESFGEGE